MDEGQVIVPVLIVLATVPFVGAGVYTPPALPKPYIESPACPPSTSAPVVLTEPALPPVPLVPPTAVTAPSAVKVAYCKITGNC